MKTLNLTNENVNQIGQKVLKAIRASDEDVNTAVADENLFEPVRMAIRAGRLQTTLMPSTARAHQHIFARQLALAAAPVLFIAAFGVLCFIRQLGPSPEIVQAPNQPYIEVQPIIAIEHFRGPSQPEPAEISARVNPNRSIRPLARRIARRHSGAEVEEVGEFQAVTYTGDAGETGNGRQIVRVRLPRSSLFALGIELPVENQSTDKIKADLLIEEDGVMRAVRIIN
jgi:hypothetical protein